MVKPKMIHVEVYRGEESEACFVCEVSDRFPLSEILKLTINTCGVDPSSALVPRDGKGGRRVAAKSNDRVGEWFKRQGGKRDAPLMLRVVS